MPVAQGNAIQWDLCQVREELSKVLNDHMLKQDTRDDISSVHGVQICESWLSQHSLVIMIQDGNS